MHAPGVFRLYSLASIRILALILVAAVLRPAQAEETGRVVELLDLPRHAALMRHATAPGTGDPDHFRLDDCTTQRNLSEAGRAEARETGRLLRAAGLADALVLTSRWCRATDTARELGLGEVDPFPPLDSFFRDRSREDAARRDILARIAERKAGDPPLIMVSHQVNITAVTGIFPASGEIVVVEVLPDGTAAVRARLSP
ncbi:histidine phosphatase family protein [Tistrella mobilis]|uniref:Histidine phosphatase family protein n=1 Tax=Tistrella mobilis TaxID=171437 RepID=A0A162JYX1_9PROT|nr:histidine phosphatase family protein [Tistrella mobilis]KYO50144.1 histidine phosphatase family protein [Tistrella mobilis]